MTDKLKSCPYCHVTSDKPTIIMSLPNGWVYVFRGVLVWEEAWDEYEDSPSDKIMETAIRFCPMCGRYLRGDNND